MSESQVDFEKAVAQTVWAWASVDSYLVLILAAAAKMSHPMASATYFSVHSTEGRLRVVSACIHELIFEVSSAERVRTIWDRWTIKANKLKRTRNKIVHGHVTTLIRGSGEPRLRLTPPFWSYVNIRDAQRSGVDSRGGSSSLSANDVKSHYQAVRDHTMILVGIPELVNTAYQAPHKLPEKFLEVEARLREMGLDVGDQVTSKSRS